MRSIRALQTPVALILLAVTSTAGAEPAQAPTAPATQEPAPAAPATAPQGQAPATPTQSSGAQDDVSQLNGQLVPVGDQHRYQLSYKRWNVSTNPIAWIFGSYGASLSYAAHDIVAIRGDVNLYAPSRDKVGYELGLGVPLYFRKMYDGLFLEPGLVVRDFRDSTAESPERTLQLGPQVLVGWHWYWDSGLNIALAGGLGRNWNASGGTGTSTGELIFFNGYLRFGYAF